MLGLFLVTSQAFAGMYRWTDDEGDVVYSQTPPPDNRPVKPIAPPPPPAENTSQIQQQTQKLQEQLDNIARERQACLRPRDRFWDIPVPKIDSAFDNLLVPQPSWSPSTTQQLRKLVAAPYLPPNDWTPRLDAYFASPLALCARRVSSAASRLLGSTSLRFALHGWQRRSSPHPWG
ncbi:DUF4124 domain-containing protein [Thiolapillus sp.]|uniref:DUF4124 domain-containing protein n=1 Tax=Thiolapillus sp. TaxID=2017437 RepID=UPI003AF9E12F